MAVDMQLTAKNHNKFATGWGAIDIVTEADLAVQKFLLENFIKTELVDCRLLPEEKTSLVENFTGNNGLYLAIDPIDGTANYAKGLAHFSVMVSLHDGKNLLYSFKHFPLLNWTIKIIGKDYQEIGSRPAVELPSGSANKVVYYRGSPKKIIPEIYKELTNKGLEFATVSSVREDISGQTMLELNKVAGYYAEDINVYDGLFSLHYAQAKKKKIYSGGPNGNLDLSNIKKRDIGLYYPGYYLVLNQIF